MATSKEYKEFVLEQLDMLDNIKFKSMMGEYLLYYNGVIFGYICDDRLLVKITANNIKYNMKKDVPYKNAKEMFLVEDIENKNLLKSIIIDTYNDLK